MGLSVPSLGPLLILLAAVAGAWAVVEGYRGRGDGLCKAVAVSVVSLWLALVALGVALVQSDFRLEYVAHNSARELALPYKIAALWAGQEGSVLLWALLVQLTAWVVLQRADGLRQAAGAVVAAVGFGFIALLIARSPFAPVMGAVPADGNGLNPLLQNPWMLAHPPVLFAGYAVLVVPAALALVALWRNEPDAWVAPARKPLLLGWALLGAGMMLGGYWAYITLGWGGFWAWDPVENASLVPWLFATALLHGFKLHKAFGGMKRLNVALAVIVLATIIWGSYLTRSGALDGFSVHSFAAAGGLINGLWLALFAVPAVVAAVLLVVRRRSFAPARVPAERASMEYATWVTALMGVLVWIGSSTPLITKLWSDGIAVDQSFYNRTQSVLFVFAGFLIVTYLGKKLGLWPAGGALVAAAAAQAVVAPSYPSSVRFGLLAVAAVAGATVVVAVPLAIGGVRNGAWPKVGAAFAHLGLGLLALGAVVSGPGQRQAHLMLTAGESVEALGHSIVFGGVRELDNGAVRIGLSVDGAAPIEAEMVDSPMGLVRRPAVVNGLLGDFYLEPESLNVGHDHGSGLHLTKGQEETVNGLKIRFDNYDMSSHMGAAAGKTVIGAKLTVDDGSGPKEVTPTFAIGEGGMEKTPVQVGETTITLDQILADQAAVVLQVSGMEPPDPRAELALVVTRKPGIGLVWLGSILLVLGGLVGLRKPAVRPVVAERVEQPQPA